MPETPDPGVREGSPRWLVDGMNLIGCRPDGWWRSRQAATRRLLEQLRRFSAQTGEPVSVVLDGRPMPLSGLGPLQVAFAGSGRDAADREIIRRLAEEELPGRVTVVTSDAQLRREALAQGAAVTASTTFRARLDRAVGPGDAPC